MKDAIFKLRILMGWLSHAFSEWKTGVWKRDLDGYYCCPGQMMDECGCRGSSVREMYSCYTRSKGGES